MAPAALEAALKSWYQAETPEAIQQARQAVVSAHASLLKYVRGRGPLTWDPFPRARNFFTQWEDADITRVLILGRRW